MASNSGAGAQRGNAEGGAGIRQQLASPISPAFPGSRPGPGGPSASFALLPLRIFLGITFIYAGIDKLTDSAFMAASGPDSIGSIMQASRNTAAIPALVDLALKSPVNFGYAIAFGELAVGIGILIGLLARLAAVGGALISLSLWLSVSWSITPYYYGNDLVYLMAWLPLVLAGAHVYSLDAVRYSRRRRREGVV
jgi:thiosulfate dehydrogenase [quinone] large subunit